jgi:ferritin-like metal-binding protein YciE
MFERLNTAEELYHYKLGAALKMEQTVLEMLDENAIYEGLITFAQAMGKGEVVELLEHNLEQEKHTLEEVRNATHHIAAQKVGSPA